MQVFQEWYDEREEQVLLESYWTDLLGVVQGAFDRGSRSDPTANGVDLIRKFFQHYQAAGAPNPAQKAKETFDKAVEHGIIERAPEKDRGQGEHYTLKLNMEPESDYFHNWWSAHVRKRWSEALPYAKIPANQRRIRQALDSGHRDEVSPELQKFGFTDRKSANDWLSTMYQAGTKAHGKRYQSFR